MLRWIKALWQEAVDRCSGDTLEAALVITTVVSIALYVLVVFPIAAWNGALWAVCSIPIAVMGWLVLCVLVCLVKWLHSLGIPAFFQAVNKRSRT